MASVLQCLIYFVFMLMSVYTEGKHFFYNEHQGGVENPLEPRLIGSEDILSNEVLHPLLNNFPSPKVSEECQRKGFCEDAPHYPKEYIKNLVAEVGDRLPSPTNSSDDNLGFVDRLGGTGKYQEIILCAYTSMNIMPNAVTDKNGRAYWVINDPSYPQKFPINICKKNIHSNCDRLVRSKNNKHTACCEQKYTNHAIAIVYNGKIAFTSVELPSSCKCAVSSQKVCPAL